MPLLPLIPVLLASGGAAAQGYAILCERRMHRHRLPGISYWQATLRRDGGWQRTDLYDPAGLAIQKTAARYAIKGTILWVLAVAAWAFILRLGNQ